MQVVPSTIAAARLSTIAADIIGVVGTAGMVVAIGIATVVGASGTRLNDAPSHHK